MGVRQRVLNISSVFSVKMRLAEKGITGLLSCSHPFRHTADTGNISDINKFNDNKFTSMYRCKFLWHLGVGGFLVLPFFWLTCKPALRSDLVIFRVLLVGIELITVQDCPSIVVSSCQRATVRITHDITLHRLNLKSLWHYHPRLPPRWSLKDTHRRRNRPAIYCRFIATCQCSFRSNIFSIMDVFFEQLYHFLGSDYIPKRFVSMIILPWRFYTLVHKSSMGQFFFISIANQF